MTKTRNWIKFTEMDDSIGYIDGEEVVAVTKCALRETVEEEGDGRRAYPKGTTLFTIGSTNGVVLAMHAKESPGYFHAALGIAKGE